MKATTSYWLGVVLALGTVLLLLLGMGALGVIGAGGPADRVFLAVPAVLVVGSLAARFRPRGMAVALLATALTQVLAPVVAFVADLEGTQGASVIDVVGLTAMFAGSFVLSAWLFRRAAGPRAETATPGLGGAATGS